MSNSGVVHLTYNGLFFRTKTIFSVMRAFMACTFNRIRSDIRARTHTIGGIAKWLMRRSRKAEVPSSNPGFAYFFYFFFIFFIFCVLILNGYICIFTDQT